MQTWLWGEMFPNDMDGLVAIASTPAAISGRNMMWREMISQAIRSDPAWKNGDHPKDAPPKNWIKAVIPLSATMTGSAEQLQKQAPTREKAIELVDKLEADGEAYDANGSSEDLSDEERVAQRDARLSVVARNVDEPLYRAAEAAFGREGLVAMTFLAGCYQVARAGRDLRTHH
jgi:homoserine acetyltransferase